MTDSSPSVPVESREQPSEGMQHRIDVAVIGMANDRAERWKQRCFTARAEAEELKAEVASLTEDEAAAYEACRQYAAKYRTFLAERDRARDLAAHLREALVAVSRNLDAMERNVQENPPGAYWAGVWAAVGSTRKFVEPALAAHLEAEQAEETP